MVQVEKELKKPAAPRAPASLKNNNNSKPESREGRVARHSRRVELNGLPEVLAALDNDEVAPAMAETISNLPKEYQLAKLEEEKPKYAKRKAKQQPGSDPDPDVQVKTGKLAKPEDEVPETIMRKILTPDLVGKGLRTCSDVKGNPCQLSPYVSELEHNERAVFSIAAAETPATRRAYAKWDRYYEKQIRQKILKVLELMSPLSIPKTHGTSAIQYTYNLNVGRDLRELAAMVGADLLRAADTLLLQEKYGHIQWTPK